MKPFVLNGVIGLRHQYTEEQNAVLRDAGISVMIELRNANGGNLVIAPPGLRITASRDAIQDVRFYQGQVRELREMEICVKENPMLFQKAYDGKVPDPLRLKLVREGDKWSVIEQSTGARFDVVYS